MQNFVNQIKSSALSVAEQLTPVLKESKFKDQGRITPEEYVSNKRNTSEKVSLFIKFFNLFFKLAAGDHLVYTCPTWSWGSGDDAKMKSYLPKDKQFLVTR